MPKEQPPVLANEEMRAKVQRKDIWRHKKKGIEVEIAWLYPDPWDFVEFRPLTLTGGRDLKPRRRVMIRRNFLRQYEKL